MTIWDKLLITTVLAAVAASFFIVGAALGGTGPGESIIVKVDGVVAKRLPLGEPTTLTIKGRSGSCRIQVANGAVSMVSSDCPNGLCVAAGSTNEAGKAIVCLPHRIVVEVIGTASSSNGVDAVVR